MSKRIRIEVTQEDIDTGIAGSPSSCPIAVSMRRVGLWHPLVQISLVYATPAPGQRCLFRLPKRAQAFVRRFDAGRGPAKPFGFFLVGRTS